MLDANDKETLLGKLEICEDDGSKLKLGVLMLREFRDSSGMAFTKGSAQRSLAA